MVIGEPVVDQVGKLPSAPATVCHRNNGHFISQFYPGIDEIKQIGQQEGFSVGVVERAGFPFLASGLLGIRLVSAASLLKN